MEKTINIEDLSIINLFLESIKKIDSLSVINKDTFFVFQFLKDNAIEVVHYEIDTINKCIILKQDHINTFHNKNTIFDELKKEAKKVALSVSYSLPSVEEFKTLAKKSKEANDYNSLGEAQNALSVKYGYKNYQAIKSDLKPIIIEEISGKLLLANINGYRNLEMDNICSSFITTCFGTRPEVNKNGLVFEYEIDLNDFSFSDENKHFFCTLIDKTNSINKFFQESFFNEISLDFGKIELKSRYELNYPFGKNPQLLKNIFNDEVITLILSIKNKNKDLIQKNKKLNEDKTLDRKIESLCLVSNKIDNHIKEYFLIDAVINKRNNTAMCRIYNKHGFSPIPLFFGNDFDKELLEKQTIEDLILEFEKNHNIKLKKETDLSIVKSYFHKNIFTQDNISNKLKKLLNY